MNVCKISSTVVNSNSMVKSFDSRPLIIFLCIHTDMVAPGTPWTACGLEVQGKIQGLDSQIFIR